MAAGAACMWSQVSPQELDLSLDFDWFLRELSPLPPTPIIDGGYNTDDPVFPLEDAENANGKVLGSDSSACVSYSASPSASSHPRENNGTIIVIPNSSDKNYVTAETMEKATKISLDNRDQNPHSDSDSKRHMRLIKNREAASQSRKRKKSYIQDLESKCRMWENYCNQLQQSIAYTCAENAILRAELNRSKRQKSNNGVAEPAVHKDSLPLESPSHLITLVDAGYLTVVHCLGWLLVASILLFPGKAVKPSSTICITRIKTEYKSSNFRVFLNPIQKRRVFESFLETRSRAFSSCRHRNSMLNNNFSPSYSECHLA